MTHPSLVRILTIDGGGVRGLIPAILLQRLEEMAVERLAAVGLQVQPLGRFFDLVAGTSTGAIIAVGLAGARPGETAPLAALGDLVRFYREHARFVFRQSPLRPLRGLVGTKHGPRPLEQRFAETCGNATLSGAATSLLIPAYDVGNRTVVFFRGGPLRRRLGGPDYFLRDVLRATTAAPSFFPPARLAPIGTARAQTLIDGGVFANNPSAVAYAEARQLYGHPSDILVVSIGTGRRMAPLPNPDWGLVGWLHPGKRLPLLEVMMHGQSAAVEWELQQLVPQQHRYFRFDGDLDVRSGDLDDASPANLRRLTAVANHMIESRLTDLARVADLITEPAIAGISSPGH